MASIRHYLVLGSTDFCESVPFELIQPYLVKIPEGVGGKRT